MLNQTDFDYLSDGFSEIFEDVGQLMYYIPLISDAPDKFGKKQFIYDEVNKLNIKGIFQFQQGTDADLDTKYGKVRVDGKIKFVIRPLKNAGIVTNVGDAIDVTSNGITKRYIIIGFDAKLELDYVFSKVLVTEKSLAFF